MVLCIETLLFWFILASVTIAVIIFVPLQNICKAQYTVCVAKYLAYGISKSVARTVTKFGRKVYKINGLDGTCVYVFGFILKKWNGWQGCFQFYPLTYFWREKTFPQSSQSPSINQCRFSLKGRSQKLILAENQNRPPESIHYSTNFSSRKA